MVEFKNWKKICDEKDKLIKELENKFNEIVEKLEEERKKIPHVQHWRDNDKCYKKAIEIVKEAGVMND